VGGVHGLHASIFVLNRAEAVQDILMALLGLIRLNWALLGLIGFFGIQPLKYAKAIFSQIVTTQFKPVCPLATGFAAKAATIHDLLGCISPKNKPVRLKIC
jgi:hypothetical protein